MTGSLNAVFVYGTLLRGETRACVWRAHRVRLAMMARTAGTLHETGADYPVMVPGAGAQQVQGDFIEVSDIQALLHELDEIEEYVPGQERGNLYVRTVVEVQVGPQRRRAWTYVAGDLLQPGPRIDSGDWRTHAGTRRRFLQALAQAHGQPEALAALERGEACEWELALRSGVRDALTGKCS